MMIISKTPLRISFVGGGTDIESFYKNHPGAVLSSGINLFVYCIIQKRFDDLVVVNYSKKEVVNNVNEVKHDLVREAMKKAGIYNGVEITTLSDIHSNGSGMGSSSAITVGLLNAFYSYMGLQKSNREIAEDACDIEINILKSPIGKQDQYAASYGGLRKYVFNQDGYVDEKRVLLEPRLEQQLNRNLFLVYTGVTREANKILSEQKQNAKKNDNDLIELSKMPDVLMKELQEGNFEVLGKMLHENWMLKKKFTSNMSKPEIDELYQKGLDNGAIGGKLLGAGGGGFILFYVPEGKQTQFKNQLEKEYRVLPIELVNAGTRIVFYE